MEYVGRINLKTSGKNRNELIDFCLNKQQQYIAIGWSGAFETNIEIKTYQDYYKAIKSHYEKKYNFRYNHVHNVFYNIKVGDLFWTRDLDGAYWICSVIDNAKPMYIPEMDVGAVVPIKAYKYGLEVPGQIKASFNRPRGGTCEDFRDSSIIEFSKKIYNELSNTRIYDVKRVENNLLDNLPDFDLEELVISYIQLHENYYLLSNSIANKSTTIKIECELICRDKCKLKKAVVQVKGGKEKSINAVDYLEYERNGYIVYFYAPYVENEGILKNSIRISKEDLMAFYKEYKSILPKSITKWENI